MRWPEDIVVAIRHPARARDNSAPKCLEVIIFWVVVAA